MPPPKLPRKEDLLEQLKAEREERIKSALPSEKPEPYVPTNYQKAKEAADVAEQDIKRRENEIKLELMNKGYKDLQDFEEDLKKQEAEIEQYKERYEKARLQYVQKQEELETERERLQGVWQRLQVEDKKINERLAQAIELEQKREKAVTDINAQCDKIEYLIKYHEDNITPCVLALDSITRTLYKWIDVLQQNNDYDFSQLVNWLIGRLRKLDDYVDNIPPRIRR